MAPLSVLEQDARTWRAAEVDPDQLLAKLEQSQHSMIIFADSASWISYVTLRNDFSTRYQVPPYFWSTQFQHSNGYFAWKCLNEDMCVRFVVKQYSPGLGTAEKNYRWYEMDFFGYYETTDKLVLLCIGTSQFLRDGIQRVVAAQTSNTTGISWLSSTILGLIVGMYDQSVWALRDVVRNIEESRDGCDHNQPNFPFLHNIARHVIHSTETLDVSINTLNSISEMFAMLGPNIPNPVHSIPQDIAFYKQVLYSLRARSIALDGRLRNEINLAFNLVALRDSKVNVQIGAATQADSAAMRTISLVTMAFLPATFVSTIFSMSFFSFSTSGSSERQEWVVSDKIWIYWVFAAPLTVATLLLWFMRERGWKNTLQLAKNLGLGE